MYPFPYRQKKHIFKKREHTAARYFKNLGVENLI